MTGVGAGVVLLLLACLPFFMGGSGPRNQDTVTQGPPSPAADLPVSPLPENAPAPVPPKPPQDGVLAFKPTSPETIKIPQAVPEPEPVVIAPPVVQPEPPVQPDQPPPPPGKVVIKRRQLLGEEDLKKQIQKAIEVGLDRTLDRRDSLALVALSRDALVQRRVVDVAPEVLKQRPDLAGLPMRMGDACKISPTAAEHLQGGSVSLRRHLFEAVGATSRRVGGAITGDTRPDPKVLYTTLTQAGDKHNKWLKAEAVPALMQLLMAENESIRTVLVEQLGHIEGPQASAALANRALFDLNFDVRKAAVEALASRPRREYVPALLGGLAYPWYVIADHAAEALVALEIKDVVPRLVSLLDQPDPSGPYQKQGVTMVKEMVRINHLRNCVLCHAPSFGQDDKVRGFVPPTNQPLPPAFTQEYYAPKQEGIFVRADITYLQQDFSVPLQVPNHGHWPAAQRFDFIIRERPVSIVDKIWAPVKEKQGPTPHQQALFFTLRGLTGEDPGPTAEDWKRLFLRKDKVTLLQAGLKMVGGVAADAQGNVYVSDLGRNVLLRIDSEGKTTDFLDKEAGFQGLAIDGQGRLLACQPALGQIVAIDLKTRAVRVVADRSRDGRFVAPTYLAVDKRGGIYFTDAYNPAQTGNTGALYYISAQGVVTRLLRDLNQPRGVGLAPDGSKLYLVTGASLDVLAYPLESVGNPGKGQAISRLAPQKSDLLLGGNGVSVEGNGVVFVAHPALRAVQAFNAEGARLGLIDVPDVPLQCAVGGEKGKTLYIATPHAVYALKVETASFKVAVYDR